MKILTVFLLLLSFSHSYGQLDLSISASDTNTCVGTTVNFSSAVQGLLTPGTFIDSIHMTTDAFFNDTIFGLLCGQTYGLIISGNHSFWDNCGASGGTRCPQRTSCATYRFYDAYYYYYYANSPQIQHQQSANRIIGAYANLQPNNPSPPAVAPDYIYYYSFVSDGSDFTVRFSDSNYGGNCGGFSYILTAGSSSFLYEWDFDGDNIYDVSGVNLTTPNYTYHTSGSYTVKCRTTPTGTLNNYGSSCRDSATVTIHVTAPTANITAVPDTNICLFDSVTLTASGGASYVWSTGSTATNIVVSPQNQTVYTVTATTVNGCVDTAAITIHVRRMDYGGISQSLGCGLDTPTLIANPAGMSYAWTVPSGFTNPGNTRMAVGVISGSYTVTITNNFGCSVAISTTVDNMPPNGTGQWPKQSTMIDGVAGISTVLADKDTNVYMTGYISDSVTIPGFGQKFWIPNSGTFTLKLGSQPWFGQMIGDGGDAWGYDVVLDTGGHVIASGKIGVNEAFMVRYDRCTGAMLNWAYPITTSGSIYFASLATSLVSGNIYTATLQENGSNSELLVRKFDGNFNLVATRLYTISPNYPYQYTHASRGIVIDANDNVYVPVTLDNPINFNASTLNAGATILKFDANLTEVSSVNLTNLTGGGLSANFTNVQSIVIDENDTLFLAGSYNDTAVLAKMSTGLVVQATLSSGDPLATIPSLAVDSSSIYLVIQKLDYERVNVVKLDKHTLSLSTLVITPLDISQGGYINCRSISISKDVVYIGGGFEGNITNYPLSTNPLVLNDYQLFAMRFYDNSFGAFQSFKTDETSGLFRSTAQALDVVLYPNPNNGMLYINISGIDATEEVSLQIWDMRGALVRELMATKQDEIISLDLADCEQGVYTLQIKNRANAIYRKFVLVR